MQALPLPVIVRKVHASEGLVLQVDLQLAGAPPRKLMRPPTESLSKSLARLAAALSKKGKNGKGGKGSTTLQDATAGDANEPRLLDASGDAISLATPALEAWSTATKLRLNEDTALVLSLIHI